jgi:hypothetical protein
VVSLLALLWATAWANGQTTHIWITYDAVSHLPDGDLKTLVTDTDFEPMLINGAMFPDGGYAVGDHYGELAHWEGIQTPYLEWIRAENAGPLSDDEAKQHIAFLLGMASHGMADQTFDSMYVELSKQNDAEMDWKTNSLDTAQDVVFAALTEARDPPDLWLPSEAMVDLFDSAGGHTVDANTLEDGQVLLQLAIVWVANASAESETVTTFEAQFPWGTAHLLDQDVPGSPPCEGEIVALYWEAVWDRLMGGDGLNEPVLTSRPSDGEMGHATDSTTVESRVFAQSLDADSLTEGVIEITEAESGEVLPITLDLFYRSGSNVVNVHPQANLTENTDYMVTVHKGILTNNGVSIPSGWTSAFSTTPAPLADTGSADHTSDDAVSTDKDCGCAGAPAAGPWWLALFGLCARRRTHP